MGYHQGIRTVQEGLLMRWGVFIGVGTLASLAGYLLLLIVVLIVLYLVLFTPIGLFILAGLLIYGLYRLFKS